MQDKSVDFGLPDKTIDVLTGHGLASKMSDEVGESQYDGEVESPKIIIVGC